MQPSAVTQPLPPEQPSWSVMDTPPAMQQIVHVASAIPSIPATVDDSWVSGLGQKESSSIATLSRSLLDKTKGTELEGFGIKIGELISTAKGLNINELKSKGIIGKLKGLFASAKERFLNQYNTATKQIHALNLHVVQQAATGGENALMDHEIAYILLRDKNPDYIRALWAPRS